MSYDNTGHLGASTWRHVAFVERPEALPGQGSPRNALAPVPEAAIERADSQFSWLMMSDVCKHCARAGCLESCPTGAIVRTEFDSVYVQPDVCNGCGYCVSACPFGVIDRREDDGRAWKCTLCYDRLREDMVPAGTLDGPAAGRAATRGRRAQRRPPTRGARRRGRGAAGGRAGAGASPSTFAGAARLDLGPGDVLRLAAPQGARVEGGGSRLLL